MKLPQLSGQLVLVVPEVSTTHGEAAFSFYAAHIRNKLLKDLRLETMLTTFKPKLKTHLFSMAFNYIL